MHSVASSLAHVGHLERGARSFPSGARLLLEPTDRESLRVLVGADVERDVYLYCCCDRSLTYPALAAGTTKLWDRFLSVSREISSDDASRFVQLTLANELDVFARSATLQAHHGPWLVDWARSCSSWLPDAAMVEVDKLSAL